MRNVFSGVICQIMRFETASISGISLKTTCPDRFFLRFRGDRDDRGDREGGAAEAAHFLCKENPRIVRGFSISFSGDFPKTKQKTSHDIEYGNAVCKLPYQFIYLGGFLHEIKRVLSK